MEQQPEEVVQLLSKIDEIEQRMKEYSKQLLAPGSVMFHVDQYTIGIINRVLSISYGFTTLIRSCNYIAALHLVRPYLDCYIRYFALWQVDTPHEFVINVMKGDRIDQMKDKSGQLMSDKRLVELASEEFPWMQNVYTHGSQFIHFSQKHILTSGKVKDAENRILEGRISKYDKYVPIESKVEASSCMLAISDALFSLIEGWIWTKSNPEKHKEIVNKERIKLLVVNFFRSYNLRQCKNALSCLHSDVFWKVNNESESIGHDSVRKMWVDDWKISQIKLTPGVIQFVNDSEFYLGILQSQIDDPAVLPVKSVLLMQLKENLIHKVELVDHISLNNDVA